MQGKHLTLLSKLEQLGQECNTLRTDLGGTLHDREAMAHVLSELELKCGQLQQQLIMEEVCHTLVLLSLYREYFDVHINKCNKISNFFEYF